MIKPKWALFFLNNPDRLLVSGITAVLIMISVTMYGEGHRRSTLAQEVKPPVQADRPASAPVPAPKNDDKPS